MSKETNRDTTKQNLLVRTPVNIVKLEMEFCLSQTTFSNVSTRQMGFPDTEINISNSSLSLKVK